MTQAKKVPVDGSSLATRVDGDAGLPWLVLSHSLGADLSMWDGQVAALTRRYRLLRYDVRGHGASDLSARPVGFADLVGDVVRLLDHYRIERAVFLGLSLGGMTGLGLALDHPARVSRLICCAARADAPPDFVRSWDERIAAVAAGGMNAVVDGILGRWLSQRTRVENPTLAAHIAAMVCRTPAAGYIACAEALKSLDYLRHLERMSVPTLYVAGEADPSAPPAVMREMATRTPGASLHVVAGAAHLINCDDPQAFARAIATIQDPPQRPGSPAI